MKPDYAAIGLRLKEVRNLKKITQQELANYIGVSVSYVKNTERGGKPSIEYLLAVADKCDASIDWLLTGVQNKYDEPSEKDPMISRNQVVKYETNYSSEKKLVSQIAEDIEHYCFPSQKVEAVFDPDLKRMIDILKTLMESNHPHMRSWAIVQFENAFKELCDEEKKQHA